MIEVKLSFSNPQEVLNFFSAVANNPASRHPEVVAEIATQPHAKVADEPAAKPAKSKDNPKGAAAKTPSAATKAAPQEPVTEPEGGWTKEHAKAALEKVLAFYGNTPETIDGKPVPALDSLKKWCMSTPNVEKPFVSITKVLADERVAEFIEACNKKAGGV